MSSLYFDSGINPGAGRHGLVADVQCGTVFAWDFIETMEGSNTATWVKIRVEY